MCRRDRHYSVLTRACLCDYISNGTICRPDGYLSGELEWFRQAIVKIYVWKYQLRKLSRLSQASYGGLHLTVEANHWMDFYEKLSLLGETRAIFEIRPQRPEENILAFTDYLVGVKSCARFLESVCLRYRPGQKRKLVVLCQESRCELSLSQSGVGEMKLGIEGILAGEDQWPVVDDDQPRDQWLTLHPFPRPSPWLPQGKP